MAAPGIYVETFIRSDLDEVWRLTQTPDVHQRWDLRFTSIKYLPRESLNVPQLFLYVTRLGPGLAIIGTGESVGERIGADGNASSALKFGSEQWWSVIRIGSGYWRYIPIAGGLRFLTWYDYEVRFGWVGRVVNACVLRPGMGWATAWSFDRLRLWVEEGQTPEVSMSLAIVQTFSRTTIGLVWLWHGLVPKLLFHDWNERVMLAQAGLPPGVLPWVGCGEIVFGLLMLAGSRWPWLFTVNLVLMIAALVGVAVRSPEYLTAAFNPVTVNACMVALSVIGLAVAKRVPTARACLRRLPRGEA